MMPPLSLRPFTFAAACGLALTAQSQAVTFFIPGATGLFIPGTRGLDNSTYFAWTSGTWDGNEDAAIGQPAIPDTLSSTPAVIGRANSNLGSLVQNNTSDIVSGSNNLYGGVPQFDLTLTIPTDGVPGAGGSTTIILQGLGLSGSAFGGESGGMDSFIFGDINGVSPTCIGGAMTGGNANGQTQFWAEYHLPGNSSSYTLNVLASSNGLGVVSVTDFSVDTWYSPLAGTFGTDTAAVPEPGSALLGAPVAALGLFVRRRRHSR